MNPETPCLFFDRDGIVNHPPPPGDYVRRPEDFRIQSAFIEALQVAARKGWPAIIVTNQQGIAKGLYTEADLQAMHTLLREELRLQGLRLLDILHCPHGRDEGCRCRKPQPGMLLEAAARHRLDLKNSWLVGDNETDVQAAHAAGCRAIRVHLDCTTAAEHHLRTMDELPALLDNLLPLPHPASPPARK